MKETTYQKLEFLVSAIVFIFPFVLALVFYVSVSYDERQLKIQGDDNYNYHLQPNMLRQPS
jgi:hypothetical protein